MDIMFVSAKAQVELGLVDFSNVPDSCGLVSTLQYKHLLSLLQKRLTGSVILGQVLGCNQDVCLDTDVSCFLYVGTGRFHPLGIAARTGKKVFCFNPLDSSVTEISSDDVSVFEKKMKRAASLFLSKDKIGILVSTKSGQMMKNIPDLEKRYPDKKFYTFACSTLDFSELENFSFVDLWVNTMCPRIGYDDTKRSERPIVNISDIKSIL
ncbi:hypothetical protein COV93_07625 [Candidatus Woesearchaeota archaeon CG11_big_fil_rev_8_21_14_0_20_43_8]|nr:MAG: hypothetical protein COV93_07625 [Candidatus Woesearchaeota archaeon CG11_big_fil_rev_8_21_14_0_20_43_8]PIO06667.1 MAG: hypothetical protein COT47_03240 [Candidatus Woesearchaeota archaeon CG08_land_8_20_14_0_20_43_7]